MILKGEAPTRSKSWVASLAHPVPPRNVFSCFAIVTSFPSLFRAQIAKPLQMCSIPRQFLIEDIRWCKKGAASISFASMIYLIIWTFNMPPHVQLWFTLHIICLISSCVPYLGGYLGQPCPKALFCILFATKRGGTGGGNDSVCISLWPVDCAAPNTPSGRSD